MVIVYSCVSLPPVVLCSHQEALEGQFEEVARSMLPNIPVQYDTKCSYTANNYVFHVAVEGGLVFMCVADKEFGRQQPYNYLKEITGRFLSCSLPNRAKFANDGEFDQDFQNVLVTQMIRYSKPDETDQVTKVKAQVEEVKGIMTQNIEKVMERGERLEDLITQTEDLEAHGRTFARTATNVRRKMWWKNWRMTACLVSIAILVLAVIILIVCYSMGVFEHHPSSGGTTTVTPTVTSSQTTLVPSNHVYIVT